MLLQIHFHVGDTLNINNINKTVRDKIFDEALQNDESIVWIGIEDNVNVNSEHPKVITAAKVLYRINRDTLQREPTALLLVNYSVDFLYEHLSQVNIGEDAYLMVVDAKHRIIYHPDRTLIGSDATTELIKIVTTPDSSLMLNLNNRDMSICFDASDLSNWTVISVIPVETLYEKTSVILRTTIIVLMACFFAVGIVATIYNRSVVEPIREITERFQRIREDSETHYTEHVPVHGEDEIAELSRWFNTYMDVLAARHQSEEERVEVAIERERIQILGLFIRDASHEFRTPLSIIGTNAYLLRQATEDENLNKRSKAIESQVQYISTLIDSMTYMTKLDSGNEQMLFEDTNLNDIVQAVYMAKQPEAHHNKLTDTLGLHPTLPIIQGDATHLHDAIERVYQNAIRYTPDGGSIAIATDYDDDRVLIKITDAGIGIPDDEIPRIFEHFYRIDKQGTTRGFGLGLTIARAIINLHQGTVLIESELDSGTTVTITLPRRNPL